METGTHLDILTGISGKPPLIMKSGGNLEKPGA
jgi:hypothetical protein